MNAAELTPPSGPLAAWAAALSPDRLAYELRILVHLRSRSPQQRQAVLEEAAWRIALTQTRSCLTVPAQERNP